MRIEGFNLQTGEITDREMTAEEIAEYATLPVYNIDFIEIGKPDDLA